MTIELLDGYFIQSDESQFALMQNVIRKNKDTEEKYEDSKTIGYYPEIRMAYHRFVKECTLKCKDIPELLMIIDKIEKLYQSK
jgi:hypothetical protein